MKIDLKGKISQEWQSAFPELGTYAQGRIYKIVGPLIIGIDLIRLRGTDNYRPHYVIYSLWGGKMGNKLVNCLAGPEIMFQIRTKKNLQFSIPYGEFETRFEEAVEC